MDLSSGLQHLSDETSKYVLVNNFFTDRFQTPSGTLTTARQGCRERLRPCINLNRISLGTLLPKPHFIHIAFRRRLTAQFALPGLYHSAPHLSIIEPRHDALRPTGRRAPKLKREARTFLQESTYSWRRLSTRFPCCSQGDPKFPIFVLQLRSSVTFFDRRRTKWIHGIPCST